MKRHLFFLLLAMYALINAHAELITFSAEAMNGTAGNTNDFTKLSGNAHVKTENMEIYADVIELSGNDFRYITATGNVTGVNTESKMNFTCGKMNYDRETKIATLERAVHLIDTEHEVTADAELIEYNQNTEISIMQISVTIIQKDNTCTSAYAIYKKNEQLLEMRGNPRVVQGSDTFRAQQIVLNLDTQEITLDGRVRGSVTTKKDEAKSDTTPETPNINESEHEAPETAKKQDDIQSETPPTQEQKDTGETANER